MDTSIKPKESSILDENRKTSVIFNGNSRAHRRRGWCAAPVSIALILLAGAALAAPHLETDTAVATAGYYKLHWSAASSDVELAEIGDADAEDWKLIYRGPDRATVISGQSDRSRVYRVREINDGEVSPWSEPVTVTVAHHALSRALAFFILGAVVFLATLALIVGGARSHT
jgi:hypothetical protein